MSKTIYIADDENNIREAMSAFLASSGYTVEAFDNGDALLNRFLEKPADLIILDIMMPGTDGLTLCTKIRAKSNVPIIIVSARDSEIDRVTGITLGSDDYLTKPFSPIELVARVKALFRRIDFDKTTVKNNNLSFGNVSIFVDQRYATCNDDNLNLTPTEFSLMKFLIEHKNKAISRKELLEKVWNYDFEVDTRSTDYAIKRLRKKLEDANSNLIIESVWGFGFKLVMGNNHE